LSGHAWGMAERICLNSARPCPTRGRFAGGVQRGRYRRRCRPNSDAIGGCRLVPFGSKSVGTGVEFRLRLQQLRTVPAESQSPPLLAPDPVHPKPNGEQLVPWVVNGVMLFGVVVVAVTSAPPRPRHVPAVRSADRRPFVAGRKSICCRVTHATTLSPLGPFLEARRPTAWPCAVNGSLIVPAPPSPRLTPGQPRASTIKKV